MLKFISLFIIILIIITIHFISSSNKVSKSVIDNSKKDIHNICNLMTNKKYIKLTNLKNSCKYTSITIPFKNRLEIHFIINKILHKINELFHLKLYFIKVEHLNIFEDVYGNKQYICNVLVNNIETNAGIKLKIDVIAYIKNVEKIKNMFNKFKIGIPSNDQLIPIATDVLVSERSFSSKKSINEIKKDNFSYLYINSINILNANCVMNGDYLKDKKNLEVIQNNIGGVNNTINEYSYIKNCQCNPYIEKAVIRNKWPRLKEEPKNRKQWPCTPALLTWNELGVPFHKLHYTKKCPGKRESTEQTELLPNYYPTLAPLPRDKGDNIWLFEQHRGIPSFPTGRSTA